MNILNNDIDKIEKIQNLKFQCLDFLGYNSNELSYEDRMTV